MNQSVSKFSLFDQALVKNIIYFCLLHTICKRLGYRL